MGEAVNSKERDGAVVLIAVVGVEIDADVSIEVSEGRWRVKRLSK
jgi:hypothetical protein